MAARRTRGRPKKTAEERAEFQRAIVDATREVFSREGYHGLSVELILQQAQVARPTFYRYFSSAKEPMELVLEQFNEDLVASISAVLKRELSPIEKVEAVLLAYRDWGTRVGPALKPLFSELYDINSPTSRHRQRTIETLTRRILAAWRAQGRALPSRLALDTLVLGVEFLGYRYHLRSRRSAADWKATRDTMLRLALGLLSDADELAHALPIARGLRIALRERTRRV